MKSESTAHFGSGGGVSFLFEGFIVAFHGSYGKQLDQVGVYALENLRKSHAYGSDKGDVFDDQADLRNPPIVGISMVLIGHSYWINSIQVEYILLGGILWLGQKYGGESSQSEVSIVRFDRDEVITGIDGWTSDGMVSQISFYTVKPGGVKKQYGPFGIGGLDPYIIKGNVFGFFGREYDYVQKMGIYTV